MSHIYQKLWKIVSRLESYAQNKALNKTLHWINLCSVNVKNLNIKLTCLPCVHATKLYSHMWHPCHCFPLDEASRYFWGFEFIQRVFFSRHLNPRIAMDVFGAAMRPINSLLARVCLFAKGLLRPHAYITTKRFTVAQRGVLTRNKLCRNSLGF